MSDELQEDFVKIVVDLSDAEDGVGGEGLWSVKVGEDLYEVRNSPWHTLEINFYDIVRAVAPSEDKKPVFVEVFRRGGHRSIHVIFLDEGLGRKDEILARIKELGATYENRDGEFYAIDLEPEVDFDAVADYCLANDEKGWMSCRWAPQPQPPGSGDLPSSGTAAFVI